MTAARPLDLLILLLGALATAVILLVIDPVGTAVADGDPTTAHDSEHDIGHNIGHDGFQDFGGVATLDGTTEGTLARFREMDPERLASLHRH